ncbi:hypothetical protein O2N63_15875 [Aliiroseovarius sp. KMU-50]|uniref:Uncharacterized protein n=1 Tax=Aliiroseovarius salicola TaxID=3009082 RepID=A0ABT4W6R2_9RHOB|nr:hypothetical protein [Aliiroseovarius sp. KMU-50]MDA5095568.1 hypothetical protein [Aliiroseovarius sp. KMU-50]
MEEGPLAPSFAGLSGPEGAEALFWPEEAEGPEGGVARLAGEDAEEGLEEEEALA